VREKNTGFFLLPLMGIPNAQYFRTDTQRKDRNAMNEEQTSSLEAQYAEAIRLERDALHALQEQLPGTTGNARAWLDWSEAITRTNRAWRELSSHTLGRTVRTLPVSARASVPGARAPSP
jgi:hypothetical protein